MIDLHTHTNSSDGIFSYEELIEEANRAKLKAIAITDHDTLDSAKKIEENETLQIIPGIEISIFDDYYNYLDIHMLGLFIDPKNSKLNKKLEILQKQRTDQKKETIKKINEQGFEIEFEEIVKLTSGSIGRPHIAKALTIKYPNAFPTMQSVFEKLIGNNGPAYVTRKDFFPFNEAISLVHDASGLAFIAHPFLYPKYDIKQLIFDFKKEGGDGIESYYDYSFYFPGPPMIPKGRRIARDFELLECGGSDFHGTGIKGPWLGKFEVPDFLLDNIKQSLKS